MYFKTLSKRLRYAIRTFFHNLVNGTSNLHLVGRSPDHIHDEYNRKITSPDTMLQVLGNILIVGDPLLLQVFKNTQDKYLVRAVINGDDIRANIYTLERFPGGPLDVPYNPDWRKDGIFDYSVELEARGENTYFMITGLDKELETDLSYDSEEPIASYVRTLTPDELESIAMLSKHNHRRRTAVAQA